METVEKLISKLNRILIRKKVTDEEISKILKVLIEEFGLKLGFADFTKYNRNRLEVARKQKIEDVRLMNFEKAAAMRNIEIICNDYIDIKKEYKLNRSRFTSEEDFLLYLYLGNAKNDELVKNIFIKIGKTLYV